MILSNVACSSLGLCSFSFKNRDFIFFSNHWVLCMMDSGLTTPPGNFLWTCGFISSGSMDLCILRFLRWSQTWSSAKVGCCPFSQVLPLPSSTQAVWLSCSFQNYSFKFTVCLLTVLPTRLVQNLLETYYEAEVAIITIIIHLYLIQLLFTL